MNYKKILTHHFTWLGIIGLIIFLFFTLPLVKRVKNRLVIGSTIPRIEGLHGLDKPIGNYIPETYPELSFGVSRNENSVVLLKIETDHCVTLKVGNLLQDGQPSRKISFNFYRAEKFKTTKPSYKGAPTGDIIDPLIPLSQEPAICPSSNTLQEPVWVLLNLNIPSEVPRGDYTLQLFLDDSPEFLIKLRVWQTKIQDKNAVRFYAGINTWFTVLGHFGKWNAAENVLAKNYTDVVQELHINPIESWIQVPVVIRDDSGKLILELEQIPNPQSSFISVYSNHIKAGMISLPNPFTDDNNVSPEDYLTAIENTIHKYKWERRAYIFLWDEPTDEDYPSIIERAKLVRQFAPSAKILITTHYVPELEPYIDIYVPSINRMDQPGFPGPEVYENLKKQGKQLWLYVSCMSHGCGNDQDAGTPDMVIDRQTSYIRSLGTLANKYHADALLYWRLNHAFKGYPGRDPWKDQWYFSGNGDGTLLYPGRVNLFGLTYDQPILSIRIKAVEEMLNDMWYYKQMDRLQEKPAWWPQALNELAKNPTDWEKDYNCYEKLREKIGNYLDSNFIEINTE